MSKSEDSLGPGAAAICGVGIAAGWSIYQWNLVQLIVAGSDVAFADATVEESLVTSGLYHGKTYTLDISYEAGGSSFQHSFSPKQNYGNLNKGDIVPIRYLPDDPEVVGLGHTSELPIDGKICLGLAAAFLIYAVFAAVFPGLRI